MSQFNGAPQMVSKSPEKKLSKEANVSSGESLQNNTIGNKEADEVFNKALQSLDDPKFIVDEIFVRNAESMARNAELGELSPLIIDLYAILRADKGKETYYFLDMGDKELFAKVLYLLKEHALFSKFIEKYPKIFPTEKSTNINE